ncbi:hypothetical protein HOV93_08580 [Planctomycetes bacterium FF15]|uniref:Uncharacterized protein n=1 Tax=Bremerella alba TaxID=980252 RepID=A0A7V9A5X4_9BACT|nr:hypothetical protein [Bremerella alba]
MCRLYDQFPVKHLGFTARRAESRHKSFNTLTLVINQIFQQRIIQCFRHTLRSRTAIYCQGAINYK